MISAYGPITLRGSHHRPRWLGVFRAPQHGRRRNGGRPIMAVGTFVLLGALAFLPLLVRDAGAIGPSVSAPKSSVLTYASSVDRFPLSLREWLPRSWDSHRAYPLVVYLHGMGSTTGWTPGGVGGDTVPGSIVSSAYSNGIILVSLNTRSDSGFYVDTVCGGPQGQDVLDALAMEQAARHVSAVYLVGFSMGSIGALSIAATHPGLIAGVAIAAPITDLFEQSAYQGGIPQLTSDLCGRTPSTADPGAVHLYQSLSPLRFHPQNFSSIRVYVTAGGRDVRAPNNFAIWPFAHANSTVVNATGDRAAALGEPAPSASTLLALHQATPSAFLFRYVFEALGTHSPLQLNAGDMLGFLTGHRSTGFYTSDYPPVRIVPAP